MDGCKEVGCQFVIACRYAPEVLEPSEHALDRVAGSVKHWAEARFPAPIDLGRDVRGRAAILDRLAHAVGVIAAIGKHQRAIRDQVKEQFRRATVGRLAAGQREAERPSEFVGERVDLGRAAAAADADRLRALPPFPPAAQRCTFMVVLSSSTSAGGPPTLASA